MGLSEWFTLHWFDFLQTVGIIGGLLLAAYTTHRDERARRVTNSIAINEQYRQIWKEFYQHPELERVLAQTVDFKLRPVSIQEELFVTMLVSHLSTVFRARKLGEFVEIEGLEHDVRNFFQLPIPKAVWEKLKAFQDRRFVTFVDGCLK